MIRFRDFRQNAHLGLPERRGKGIGGYRSNNSRNYEMRSFKEHEQRSFLSSTPSSTDSASHPRCLYGRSRDPRGSLIDQQGYGFDLCREERKSRQPHALQTRHVTLGQRVLVFLLFPTNPF